MNKIKMIFIFLMSLALVPLATAFTLSVNCPDTVNAGSQVTCTVDLDQTITEVFGDQFEINAPGFTEGTPFLETTTNSVGAHNTGGLGAITILLKLSQAQNAGPVGTFNLLAGSSSGTYTISLTDYVTATGVTSDSITVTGGTITTSGGSGSSSGGGGSSGGTGSSGTTSGGTGTTTTGTPSTGGSQDTTDTPGAVEQPTGQDSFPTGTQEFAQPATDASSPPRYGVAVAIILGVLLIIVIVAVVIHLRKRKVAQYPGQ